MIDTLLFVHSEALIGVGRTVMISTMKFTQAEKFGMEKTKAEIIIAMALVV